MVKIIKKLIENFEEKQLLDLLISEEDTIPIEEAISNSKKRWVK